ncbi:efflux RND transporter periplasmic adaptor subunit [Methylobacterium sp. J-070]|uniref:efflux RND transporter periplasmic adaptor subunit n=1 Tax=Methylobacterium sp. J-070 TaxID=2836650 RepID=UPI001FB91833|nr:HlyD family efflux transporter periplasmic adaptor subunit [Methylobacterium sp. J-070]MCJ2050493.1 efflux RND transporter periplasmic adaptor subunit [Methylobacterium sp. J-070]
MSVRPAQTRCFTETVEMAGHLTPREIVDVGPDREGFKVAQVLVEPLDAVSAGQPLANLVPVGGGNTPATSVTAPVSGTVLRSQGVVGQPVSPRQGPMFQIAAQGEIELVAQVPLAVLSPVKAGQPTIVRPLGGGELTGRVRLIEPGADPADQAARVRIALTTRPNSRVGTFARGTVTVERRCGLGIPYSAIQYSADGTVVQVVDGERIETRQVAVGLLNGGDAEIRSGLTEADLVVVRAGAFLREGDRVKPIVAR